MRRRIRGLLHVSRRDPELLWIAAQVYVLLVAARGVITAFHLRTITRYLGTPMEETSTDDIAEAELRYARRVGWAVQKMSPYTPLRSNCYPQALTAWYLMHRKGVPTTFYYGAAFQPGHPALHAHVWLRCGPLIVTGASTVRQFRALSWFADVPSARGRISTSRRC